MALQVVLQLTLSACAGLALVVAWRGMLTLDPGALTGRQFLFVELGEVVAITLSIALARRILDHRSFASLGLHLGWRAVQDFAAGLGITLAMMGLIFLVELKLGWMHVVGFAWQSQPAQEVLLNAGTFALVCVVVGWNEELMSRGYHLQTVASGTSIGWGWFLSSVVFGVLHLGNPNANWIAVLGIFLAGLFLGFGFIRTGQLWLSMGLHTGWNLFEGVVFGFPVSGLAFYPLPRIIVDGPALWTGGDFGPEAGLVLLPALTLGFLLVLAYTRSREQP